MTTRFDELAPTLLPSSFGDLLNGHIIRNPSIEKFSFPSQALNPSPVPDQTTVSSSISIGEATSTIPPLGVTLVAPSKDPILGSSHLPENEAEYDEDVHETSNLSEPNEGESVTQNENGDDATQDANEQDAYQGNETVKESHSKGIQNVAHTNNAFPINEDEHGASDEMNVGSNMGAESLSIIAQEAGIGIKQDSDNSSTHDETTTTGASHQTSTLDYSSDNDSAKLWILVAISTAMGVLVIVIAVLGLTLYRRLKQMDESMEPTFKCTAYAPLV
jgi:hypothetical protein